MDQTQEHPFKTIQNNLEAIKEQERRFSHAASLVLNVGFGR